MAIISGRYGSVQRILPRGYDASGKAIWGSPNEIEDSVVRNPSSVGTATAASMTDKGTVMEGKETDHHSTVSAVTSWSLENTMQPITYTASNTRGYQGKLEGVHSASGNIAGIGAVPPIAPGQRFRFYGYTGPSNGKIDNYEGVVYRVSAIANSVQVQINYQLTNPITWTIGWQSDWQQVGDELWCNQYDEQYAAYGFWDYTKPECQSLLPSSTECLSIEGIENPVCLLDANIQFQTDTSPFTNSCSSAVGGWQSCVVGPTSCTVAANIHGDNYGDLYSKTRVAEYYKDVANGWDDLQAHQKNRKFWPGSNHTVRIAVGNQGAYWEFKKLMFTSFGGLSVDTTSNNPIQFSCNMEFNAYPMGENGCEPGYIIYSKDGGTSDDSLYRLVDLRPSNERDYDMTYETNETSCPSTQNTNNETSSGF